MILNFPDRRSAKSNASADANGAKPVLPPARQSMRLSRRPMKQTKTTKMLMVIFATPTVRARGLSHKADDCGMTEQRTLPETL
jgi:hypothetical protein